MEAQTPENGSPAAQRAAKKATRRAAFIQDVAAATALLVCGPRIEPSQRGPFAEAMRRWEDRKREQNRLADEQSEVLYWAKQVGLLPQEVAELPSEEIQQHLILLNNLAAKARPAAA